MKILVSAPHPNDEVLGVGGTILRRKSEGYEVAWPVLTSMSVEAGRSAEAVRKRKGEIAEVSDLLGFNQTHVLDFPPVQLDKVPISELVAAVSEVFKAFQPESTFSPTIYVDIELFHKDKLRAMNVYESEVGDFHFPRSDKGDRALAALRGAASGFEAAEAVELLQERC